MRNLTRKAQKKTEQEVVREAKRNPQKFWRFVKNKLKTSSGTADLKTHSGNNINEHASTNVDKARVLSEFFGRVYTREPEPSPEIIHNNNISIPVIIITPEQVKKQLKKIKVDKSL